MGWDSFPGTAGLCRVSEGVAPEGERVVRIDKPRSSRGRQVPKKFERSDRIESSPVSVELESALVSEPRPEWLEEIAFAVGFWAELSGGCVEGKSDWLFEPSKVALVRDLPEGCSAWERRLKQGDSVEGLVGKSGDSVEGLVADVGGVDR